MRRLMFLEFSAVALLSLLAGLGFERVFAGSGLIAPLIGAAVLPTLVTFLGMSRRASAAATLLWSFVVFLVYCIYAALGSTAPNVIPTLTTFKELARGLTGGWAELLTISLPAPVEPRLLVGVLALTWTSSAISSEFAHRSRSAIAPVVPALCVYLAGLAFAASEPHGTLVLPVAIAGAVLFVLLVHANRWAVLEPAGLRRNPADEDEDDIPGPNRRLSVDTSANRWVTLGLPVIAAALVAAALVAPRLPERSGNFDPRSLRNQQVVQAATANPLEGLKAELGTTPNNPPVRFTVETPTIDDAAALDRIRLTVLDRFDGATWSSSARFAKAGSTLPPGPDNGVATRELRQSVVIASLGSGPWLPAADRPSSIDVNGADVDIAVDATTGVLIASGPTADLSYVVTSKLSRPTDEQLASFATAPASSDTSELTDVPNMPAQLRQLAQNLVGDAKTPYERLTTLESALKNGNGYSEQVASGTSYGRMTQFLQDRVGYAEQFASTYATLARSLGFPTRLVYGYLTTDLDTTATEAGTKVSVTSRQAHVWPEVLLGGSLWVPFEPTPARGSAPPAANPAVADVLAPGGVVPEEGAPSASTSSGGAFEEPKAQPFYLSTPFLAAVTLVAALVLLLVSLVVLKRLRRRRRRNGKSTTHQVLGAWAEVTDRLLEVGVALDRSMTAKEVVAVSAVRVSPQAAERLGVMVPYVTVALYSPVPPTEDGADEMWEHADAFHREVLEGQQWYRGTVALLNPRPLLLGVNRH